MQGLSWREVYSHSVAGSAVETCLQGGKQAMEYILESDGHLGRFKNMDINITFPGNL